MFSLRTYLENAHAFKCVQYITNLQTVYIYIYMVKIWSNLCWFYKKKRCIRIHYFLASFTSPPSILRRRLFHASHVHMYTTRRDRCCTATHLGRVTCIASASLLLPAQLILGRFFSTGRAPRLNGPSPF
jgi:hypothetical protein